MPCSPLRWLLLKSAIFAIGIIAVVPAASAAVADRIPAVFSNAPAAIPNSVHPNVLKGTDLGPTPGETKLGMSIRFNMTDAQSAALDQLLADQQDPTSPRYHQWLTPAQYAAQFGLSPSDIAKVSAWLASQGFTVTGVANGGSFITFDGTVAQAQAAFGTSIHNLSVNGETHFANVTNISLPDSFAGVVTAITGLHNFRFEPHLRTSPQYTSSVSQNHFVAPGDIYTIYNVNPLLTTYTGAGIGMGANCKSSPSGTLCGDIAVTGQVDIYPADVQAFRSASGLGTTNLPTTVHEGTPPGPPVCTSCTTGANQSDLSESSIDVEWSGAMAPAANILFVNGIDVFYNAMTQAIDQNLAPIVTTSYGACEAGWGTTELNTLNALFKQANAQGQTVLAAAADAGATDCDTGPTASEGLNADFPSTSPYVTSLGGTQFNDGTALGATQYWSANNGTTGGSALSYIPESVWNDQILFNSYGGGGGGASAYFTKPAWQIGLTAADGSRDVPDLSIDASDGHEPFLYCVNVATGTSCGSGYRVSTSNSGLEVAGGTSFDSQIFGGMLALIEQKIGSRIGNANPTLYALGSSATYYMAGATTASLSTVVFNDVTTGNNAMPCVTGSPNCGNGGTAGYNAKTGYDLASGWGSPNLYNMANAWNVVKPLSTGSLGANLSVTSLAATPASVTADTNGTTGATAATVTLTATVTGSAGTPTGSVLFLSNNTPLASAVTVAAQNATTATATYSWITTCNNLGQNVVTASYSGDSNYQGSIGPILTAAGATQTSAGSFVVSPIEIQVASTSCPDFSVTPGSTAVTVAAGGTIPAVTITAAAINGFTGAVVFSATATSSTGYPLTITFSPSSITLPSSSPTTSLQISGITADLRLPNAPGQSAPGIMPAQHMPWYAAGSGVTIASLLLLILPRKRRLGGLLLVVLSFALIGGATGCGSSQPGPPTTTVNSNPYVGTYSVTVVGTYTNTTTRQVTTHSQLVTYTIN